MKSAFICDYIRTPIGRYGGTLSSVRADDLAAIPLAAILHRHPDLPPEEVDEVIMGCANQAGEDNRNVARMATLLAGFPDSVPATTINRLCGSGMDAVLVAARQIQSGDANLLIAGGVESMSRAPLVMPKSDFAFSRRAEIYDTTIGWRFINPRMRKLSGTDSMPETGENVAADFAVSRAEQDAFALHSQHKAERAGKSGRLSKEIMPVTVCGKKGDTVVSSDEHPRSDTTAEKLAALPAPFRENGTVTAGNSSGINDGSAALLVASETAMQTFGLTPLARIVGGATAGVSPRIMGIGPVRAVEKLCARTGIAATSFNIIEINEAFAAQTLAVLRELRILEDADYVNPNGGAIALGHPLGMSGARICGTAALELSLTGGKTALAAMCVGVGQGIAIALAAD